MKAIVIEQFGDPNVFQLADLPKPEVVAGHLLVRVAATSVNPVDIKIREGVVADIAPTFPAVLHGDMAGIVEAVGAGVTDFQVGDEVYGCVGGVKGTPGVLAEYVLVDARLVALKPRSLTFSEAAALPLVTITAWEGLIDRARIQPNQNILVYGSTGGVGHIAVQLAKWVGAKVYAMVSSEEKGNLAYRLGATVVINYRQTSVEQIVAEHTQGKGFDVVFDTVGNNNLQNAFQAAKLNGTVVSLVSLSTQDLTLLHAKGLTLHLVYMLLPLLFGSDRSYHGKILTQVAQLVDQEKLFPVVDAAEFTFQEVSAAHAYAASGAAIGKVVLRQSF